MSGVPHPFLTVLQVSERGIGEKNAKESEQKGRTQNTHREPQGTHRNKELIKTTFS